MDGLYQTFSYERIVYGVWTNAPDVLPAANLTAHSDSLTRIRCQKCCSYGDMTLFHANIHCACPLCPIVLAGVGGGWQDEICNCKIRGENFDIARPQGPQPYLYRITCRTQVRLRAVALSSHLSQLSLPSSGVGKSNISLTG